MASRASLLEAYQQRREAARLTRSIDTAWRLVVLVVGATVVALGAFFLIFPGPGWATIWLGLVVLASEFAWARRLLAPLQRALDGVNARVRQQERAATMRRTLIASMVAVCLGYVYVAMWGFTDGGVLAARRWIQALLAG